jgi:DNA-binding transcriptional LysR family regulator
MELRHLRYFRAVAESRGFREAARRLHIVQPALSQTVSDLEQELGVQLLVRNSRTMRLTPEGQIFLEEAKRPHSSDFISVMSLVRLSLASPKSIMHFSS